MAAAVALLYFVFVAYALRFKTSCMDCIGHVKKSWVNLTRVNIYRSGLYFLTPRLQTVVTTTHVVTCMAR